MVRQISAFSRQLISRKILRVVLDDLAVFGSIPFYVLVLIIMYLSANMALFYRLLACFIVSMAIIIIVKSTHFKHRPRKEEFTIFMEKVMASSFPSAHSLNATVLMIMFSATFKDAWVIALSLLLAVLVYFHRYIAKKHFIIDILGGITIGIIESLAVLKFI